MMNSLAIYYFEILPIKSIHDLIDPSAMSFLKLQDNLNSTFKTRLWIPLTCT